MSTKKSFALGFLFAGAGAMLALLLLAFPVTAQAGNDNQCSACHENLYYLHDTGKAYCLKEAPMVCADCHGGDPNAVGEAAAHAGLVTHPVINEDDQKCYECHPAEAAERVTKFSQVAGIRQVRVAAPYEPAGALLSAGFPETRLDVSSSRADALFFVAGVFVVMLIAYKLLHG